MATATSDFERAVVVYQRELGRLLEEGSEGKFALISAGEVRGIFATNAEARQAGHERYGLKYFLTKEVSRCDLGTEQYGSSCRV